MVEHLSERGEPFVSGGKLAIRKERFLYSLRSPNESAGNLIRLRPSLYTNHYTDKRLEREAVCRL